MEKRALEAAYRNLNEDHYVLYVDETYNRPEENLGRSFYLICGVLISARFLDATREDIREIVDGGYWHTTEALQSAEGRQKAEGLLTYCNDVGDKHIFAYKKDLTQIGEENEVSVAQARDDCLKALLVAVQQNYPGTRLVVMEKRQRHTENDADRRLIKHLRSVGAISRYTQVLHESPKEEHLLWLPDLSAMALRRSKTHHDRTGLYFKLYLEDHSFVIDLDKKVENE
ncbi:hypothetical protein [uncultured Corynebacterium sp.]|uniref:hypothetical protein n=1 Tax=uncultured Corynebacterium sp. TaxID=159447 RepID=UPI0025964CA9|nr:hypothetical protein [uncultured Corynebacterium sp.]